MIRVFLPDGRVVKLDLQDWPLFQRYAWRPSSKGYLDRGSRRRGLPKTVLFHREILDFPRCGVVDHINQDKLDNRRENLRIVSPRLNSLNSDRKGRRNPGSRFKGVTRNPSKYSSTRPWRAMLVVRGVVRHLGVFETEELAAEAYRLAKANLMKELE
jgi:hypothetical protein